MNDMIYDNVLNALYIRINEYNPEYLVTIIDKVNKYSNYRIMLDIRGLDCLPDDIQPLISLLKNKTDIVALINSKTNIDIMQAISRFSATIIDYDKIVFKTEEEKKFFEDNITDGIDALTQGRIEKLNVTDIQEYLNELAKMHFKSILDECTPDLSEEKKEKLNDLLTTDMVICEPDHKEYAAKKLQLGEEEESKEYPPAHGGKVFGDGKIHMYLNKFKSDDFAGMEGVLIHELFHYVISPAYSEKYPEIDRFNSHITEGLVDMSAIDYMRKMNIIPEYQSNYDSETIFVRDKLKSLDDDSKKKLIYNGSIDQFIENTSLSSDDFIKDYEEAMTAKTKFDIAIIDLSELIPHHQEAFIRNCKRIAARTSSEEALMYIKESINELLPDAIELNSAISSIIDSYGIETSAKGNTF